MEFENDSNLNPEMTVQDLGIALFQGINEGKLERSDVIKLTDILVEECYNPTLTRILVRACSHLLWKDKEGVFVELEGKQYIVSRRDDEIVITGPTHYKEAKDGQFVTLHDPEKESKADVLIDAHLDGGKFIEEDKNG